MSDAIEEQRRRSSRTPRMTRKARRALRRGLSKPSGITVSCGCRFARTGDAWRHITPCRSHRLGPPLSDAEMKFLTTEDA